MYCTQLFAYSEDGYKLEKDKELIIHPPKNIKQHEFRDPKLYKKDDKYYFIAVAMNKDDETGILIYESEDLKNWKVVNSYFTKDHGLMWECPDYFELDGQEVFFCSVIKSIYEDTEVVVYTTCDMESEINLGEFSRLDYGKKFYAPQTFVDDDGRRLMIGWLRMEEPFLGEEWTGMMSVMRELSYKNGAIHQHPVKEIDSYYKDTAVISCDGGSYCSSFAENIALDIRIDELQTFEALNIYLDEKQHISITKEKEKVFVETNLNKDTRSYQFENVTGSIRMIKDRHAIELFIDDGRYVISDYYEIHNEEFTVNVIGNNVVGEIHVVR
jgi:beta-fructofuranosidase